MTMDDSGMHGFRSDLSFDLTSESHYRCWQSTFAGLQVMQFARARTTRETRVRPSMKSRAEVGAP